MSLRPCIECGEPGENARCTDCATENKRQYGHAKKTNAAARGYDWAWTKLSRKARRRQPWCKDCGTPDRLTADHSPEAWEAKAQGLPITLAMIDVVCMACNIDRGDARPGGTRSKSSRLTLPVQAKSASIAGDSH